MKMTLTVIYISKWVNDLEIPKRVARIWKRGGGYFERVRIVQTTLTRIFIVLESVSHGLSENSDEISRKAREFEGFFHPKSGGLQKNFAYFTSQWGARAPPPWLRYWKCLILPNTVGLLKWLKVSGASAKYNKNCYFSKNRSAATGLFAVVNGL